MPPLRKLGKSDLMVAPIGLGCWQFSKGRGLGGNYWPTLQDEEIEQILGHTGLWEELQEKKGLETPASSLSGGQQQRLHFALIDFKVERNGPMILIIDEGTSDLDPVAEMLVVGRMNTRAEGGSTVIQVAHRGPAIDAANHIQLPGHSRIQSVLPSATERQ